MRDMQPTDIIFARRDIDIPSTPLERHLAEDG